MCKACMEFSKNNSHGPTAEAIIPLTYFGTQINHLNEPLFYKIFRFCEVQAN